MRLAIASLVIAIATCGACAARTGLYAPEDEDASVDASHHDAALLKDVAMDTFVADVVSPPSPLCASPDAGVPTTVCTDDVHVGLITVSMSTCFVDLVVQFGQDGFLSFACNGDTSSWADAKFPDGGFTGTIHGSTVDLCTGTVFPWSDGCTWASAQRITGDLDSGTLAFTYEEMPIEGGPCEPPCSAQGSILVQ